MGDFGATTANSVNCICPGCGRPRALCEAELRNVKTPVDRLARRAIEEMDAPDLARPIGTPPYGAYGGAAQARIAPPAPDGMPPVQSQLRTTSVMLDALDSAVTQLEQQAGYVLQSDPPATQGAAYGGASTGDVRGMSPGACAIEEVNRLLDRQITRLRSVIRRLEV